jgi:polyhydroxyalkanoate synthesis regulator phasin
MVNCPNCSICGNPTKLSDPRCQNCNWPFNAESDKRVIEWAINIHGQLQSFLEQRDVPSSGRKEKFIEIGQADITAFNKRLSAIEQQTSKVNELEKRVSDLQQQLTQVKSAPDPQLAKVKGDIDQQLAKVKSDIDQHGKSFHQYLNSLNQFNNALSDQQKRIQIIETRQSQLASSMGATHSKSAVPTQTTIASQKTIEAKQSAPPPVVVPATAKVSLTPVEAGLVKEYNGSPLDVPYTLRNQAESVSIDEESFNRLRDGNNNDIVLKKIRKGSYLVVSRGGAYYLIPDRERKVTDQTYVTTQAIYTCEGYSKDKDWSAMHLVKPALVTEVSAESWRLAQKGSLQFT